MEGYLYIRKIEHRRVGRLFVGEAACKRGGIAWGFTS